MAMKPEIKTRWVAKLREEGRQQTTSMLRDENGAQCCLDVLCEVAIEDKVIAPPELTPEGSYGYQELDEDGGEYTQTDVLPKVVRDWAEVTSTDPVIQPLNGLGVPRCASYLNDHLEYSFKQIADMIEADETL